MVYAHIDKTDLNEYLMKHGQMMGLVGLFLFGVVQAAELADCPGRELRAAYSVYRIVFEQGDPILMAAAEILIEQARVQQGIVGDGDIEMQEIGMKRRPNENQVRSEEISCS